MPPVIAPTRDPTGVRRWDVATARRRSVSLGRWVSLGSLGLMLCLWVAIILSTWSVRGTAMRRAASSANNLAVAFSEQVNDTLDMISAEISLTAYEIRRDPNGFNLTAWARELPSLVRPALHVSWLDARGRLIATTLKAGLTGIDLSGREHVKAQLARHDPGLFVGVPEINRLSGQEAIQVTKRVDDAAGHPLGILVYSLSASALTHLHRNVFIGPHGVIALVGNDRRVRARFDGWPTGLMPRASGQITTSDALDGVTRIYAFSRLPNHPLFVAAGLDLNDELSDARSHALLMIGIGVAASALLVTLNLLLMGEIRTRSSREIDLAEQHEALMDARSELLAEQSKLAAMNRELVASSERAEAASLAKSQFLAQMSHELRTPLHAVIGFSELILHRAAPVPEAEEIAGYANDISKSGRHLLELINSILDLSKVESGTATLAESVVPLADVIADSATTVRERAQAGGVALVTRLPADMPDVLGDTTKLRQIFINLLSNAVKFTPAGGSVAVSARRPTNGGCEVSVADSGIGMTEAELAIALEPFGQVENSLARSFEGTGLGLPLARRMIEMHGGRLTLHSVKGVGTTVAVLFPAERVLWADPPRQAHADDDPPASGT
jgi:signal transduction histidine kinase